MAERPEASLEKLRTSEKRLAILSKIIAASVSSADLDAFLEVILETFLEYLDFTAGGIYLIEADRATLRHHVGLTESFVAQTRDLDCHDSRYKAILKNGKPLFTSDYSAFASRFTTDLKALVSLPLVAEKGIVGVLNVASPRSYMFTAEERGLFTTLSKEVGKAIAGYLLREELREKDRLLEAIFAHIPALFFIKDPQGRYMLVNAEFERLFGVSSEDLEDQTDAMLVPPSTAAEYQAHDQEVLASGEPRQFEETLSLGDGTRTYTTLKFPLRDAGGKIYAIAGIAADITERKRLESMLATQNENLAVTLRSIGDGVITTDIEGRVRLMNPRAETLTGFTEEEARGQPITRVFRAYEEESSEHRLNPVKGLAEEPSPSSPDTPIASPPSTRVHHLLTKQDVDLVIEQSTSPIYDRQGKLIGAVIVFRDVTQKRQMEARMQQTQRIEAIGHLAGGIAHDFNNLLTQVLGTLSILDAALEGDPVNRAHVEETQRAAFRARDLANQLLTFSKGGSPVRETIILKDLIRETASFALRGAHVQAEFLFDSGLWPVRADAAQLHQVIQNLVINAIQASPSTGTIRVAAANLALLDNNPQGIPGGQYVQVSVQDFGSGIPKAILPKVFDLYFTTKPHGTGLGLPVCQSIIANHGGTISLDSKEGVGTTVTFLLPASPGAHLPTPKSPATLTPGTERILVLEDEPGVRRVLGAMLKRLDYTVAFAIEGEEAIRLYQEAADAGEPFDAVIMDLTIPGGLGGKEALARLLTIDPGVKAIVSSGYATGPVMSNYHEHGFVAALVKPYTLQELSTVLRDVLGGNDA